MKCRARFWGVTILCSGLLSSVPAQSIFTCTDSRGKKITSDNPWDATTLEWQTPTPPPHGNFAVTPQVFRGPYEYSVPGEAKDFSPQNQPTH